MGLTDLFLPLMKKFVMGDMDALENALVQRPDAIHASADAPARFDMLMGVQGWENIRPPAATRSLPQCARSIAGCTTNSSNV